ncbi:hypothetical protein DK26_23505 [Bosea sp. WAO]|uniref:hypothetical protein n=1 Tax=Bosea sp. WAO TaxID=406341 RepID=UPI00074B29E6|nr:hypothetical protein [Bosea sp. WAO]KUL93313.1 hypothetical protein DK26_23505 [Bosea sp. WAO]
MTSQIRPSGMRTFRARIFLAAATTLLIGAGFAGIARAEVADGPAKRDIERHLGRKAARVVEAPVFYGDFNGDGRGDAVAFIYAETGGNSTSLDVLLFTGGPDGFRFFRRAEGVFGEGPRNVAIRPGAIDVTLTTLGPRDARCCPTQEKNLTIEISGVRRGRR